MNVTAGRGSTGVIAEEIGAVAVGRGWESWIAYGREPHRESASELIRIGCDFDVRVHGLQSRLLDNHGLASRAATRRFVRQLSDINPDIVHLHNIHGYYLNYPILFDWLKRWGGPVVWTLHDCWPLTGHCAHFMSNGCDRWLTECHHCPLKRAYPASIVRDASRRNFGLKKALFSALGEKLTIVACSDCVANYARQSFIGASQVLRRYNGVDLDIFHPSSVNFERKIVIAVASNWSKSKGFEDFATLRRELPSEYDILIVGLTEQQLLKLPEGISGIRRTSSREELAALYSGAIALVNPTYEDNFPTVNIEALACGTPVITYRTGGSPEAIDENTGVVVEQGDVRGLVNAINKAERMSPADCRARAEQRFNKADRYREYVDLYEELLNK